MTPVNFCVKVQQTDSKPELIRRFFSIGKLIYRPQHIFNCCFLRFLRRLKKFKKRLHSVRCTDFCANFIKRYGSTYTFRSIILFFIFVKIKKKNRKFATFENFRLWKVKMLNVKSGWLIVISGVQVLIPKTEFHNNMSPARCYYTHSRIVYSTRTITRNRQASAKVQYK